MRRPRRVKEPLAAIFFARPSLVINSSHFRSSADATWIASAPLSNSVVPAQIASIGGYKRRQLHQFYILTRHQKAL